MGINRRLVLSLLLTMPVVYGPAIYAATPVDLSHQNISAIQSIIAAPFADPSNGSGIGFEEFNRSVDLRKTLHVRFRETYLGYQVWGGDAIVHVPNADKSANSFRNVLIQARSKNGSMDGTIYKNISADLETAPQTIFTQAQAQKATQQAIVNYQTKIGGKPQIKDQQSQLIVFMDDAHKAHWAYKISFFAEPVKAGEMPGKPVYIMDAVSFEVYAEWNDIKTWQEATAFGGGFGGNKKMGKLVYDGLKGDLAKLSIMRDAATKNCFLKNQDVTVRHYDNNKITSFSCDNEDSQHLVYWADALHSVNGGYSPDNDALFGGSVIKAMYQKWYNVPVLTQNGKPMMLTMVVHDKIDNAYWDGKQMTFGDGVRIFYPLTSLGVAAHEVSHGFTEQHSDLNYYGQSGGMNEAFSDMAAQAAELFAYAKNSWQIGPEIFKAENEALRYMDKPSKDCKGKKPGNWCSIDNASQYYSGLDVHYSSGVYNRFFYLLGTSQNWDAKKAFDVMVHANMNYWTSNVNFAKGACGVLKATRDLGYDEETVRNAFTGVAIDTSSCA